MSQRKHSKYENITSRWGGMKLREEFEIRIDNWLKLFDEKDHPMLLSLLSNFYYYSENKIKTKTKELYEKFKSEFSEFCEDIIYTKIIKEYGTSYSDIVFNAFWLENNLKDDSEPNFLDLIKEAELESIPRVVAVVDDYSGSGQTFIKNINKILSANHAASSTHFAFLVLHITEEAIREINKFSVDTGVKITVVFLDRTDKTFNDDYLYKSAEAKMLKKQYGDLYKKHYKNQDFIFGFQEIESLVAFQYNTPNNTLGLFWQDMLGFSALFPRHRKKRTTLMKLQSDVKKRKDAAKINVVYGFHENEANYALFMVYCVSLGKEFSFEQAKEDFGLSEVQLSELVYKMVHEGYIISQNDRFIATDKLKAHAFVSRFAKLKNVFKNDDLQNEEKVMELSCTDYIPKKF